MTADRANPPELDQLADFAAGLLDGSPEGDAIAAQIERDPAVARLHAALVHADNVVRAELRALAAPAMPADVFAQLDAALAAEAAVGAETAVGAEAAAADEPTDVDSRQRPARPDGGADAGGDTGTGRVVPLRRRRSWLMGGGAAAAGIALVAAGAVGLGMFTETKRGSHEDSTAASAPHTELKGAPPGAPGLAEGGVRDTASGTEYRAETLAVQIPALLGVPAGRKDQKSPSFDASTPTAEAALRRLLSPAELANCLASLGASGPPLVVDYARYAGAPAVVIVLPSRVKPSLVDVAIVGPDCGRAGSDSRLRSTVPVTR